MKTETCFTSGSTRCCVVARTSAWLLVKMLGTTLPLLALVTTVTGQNFAIVHDFSSDVGGNPWTGLVLSGDTLYGTTGSPGQGAVFKVRTDGSGYTVLHVFDGSDGAGPYGDLELSGTTLFGTTYVSGSGGAGTIYKLNTDGSGFAVLKAFSGGAIMSNPKGGVIVSGSTLYGTTFNGGVFKLNTDGSAFTNLGVNHYGLGGKLLLAGNTLYGLPFYSTPFKVNTDGTGHAGLCSINRTTGAFTLLGTILYGTAIQYDSLVEGYVFKVATNGSDYAILHSFGPAANEGAPYAGVTLASQALVGTTANGGASSNGTVFALAPDGSGFATLRMFSGSDGAAPHGALVVADTNVYGTAVYGGAANKGVVFRLSLVPPTVLASPQNQKVVSGETVKFTVSVSGCPELRYHWFFNETNFLCTTTNNSLALTNVQRAQAGTYNVVVTNLFGAATSSPAALEVRDEPPALERTPPSQTAELGCPLTLSVEVEGSLPMIYRWYFNETNALGDATNAKLVFNSLQFSNSGVYCVIVTNIFGGATSPPAQLNVILPVERRPVPGLRMWGEIGNTVYLESSDRLDAGASWSGVANLQLGGSPQYYFDLPHPMPGQRFYRAWQSTPSTVIPNLECHMIPALTLTGSIDSQVRVDGINQFGPTDAWFTLDTLTLTNDSQLYFDVSIIGQPARLYRLVPLP